GKLAATVSRIETLLGSHLAETMPPPWVAGLASSTLTLTRLAADTGNTTAADSLEALGRRYRATAAELEGAVSAIAAAEREPLTPLARTLTSLGSGEGNLFGLRAEELTVRQEATAIGRRAREHAAAIAANVAQVATNAEAAARHSAQTTARQVNQARWKLLGIVAATVLGPGLLVWTFIGHGIIGRLAALAEDTRRVAAGRLDAPIRRSGGDEITEMADALLAFRNSVAELKSAQQSLVQAEKMAALGGLVAGVAHEINTPVGNAITAASVIEEQTRIIQAAQEGGRLKASDFRAFLAMCGEMSRLMLNNLQRAGQLVQSFKEVAVDQTSEAHRRFQLADYINDVLLSLKPRLRRTAITVRLDCPPTLTLDSYPGAIAQVITNLVVNSLVHAYDEDSSGTLALAIRPLDEGWM
ncbi:MAG: HAMP domain-containing protein, partial [Rhodospirillales bacterium]|nr:HAMP domain-containing protein [Rhodospirillales bacterium]